MKKIIKVLVLMMCLCFVTGTLFACAGGTENTSFKLKEYYFSIYEGDSRAIETLSDSKLEYTYELGNSEVVSVSADGVVTGLKAGSSAIIVKSGDLAETMMVEVVANERYIKLNILETNKVVGSTFDIVASVYDKGAVSNKVVTWNLSTDVDNVINNNVITLNPKTTGDVIVTATCEDLVAECKIKVVNVNSVVLAKPDVSVENCNTLTWTAVENATKYAVLVSGEEWVELSSSTTSYQVPQVADLKDGEKVTVAIRSKADSFDYIDSDLTTLTLSHNFVKSTVGEPAYSCTQAGTIKYDCACGVNYTVSNYVDEHNYFDGKCLDCDKVQTEGIIYAFNAELGVYYVAGCQESIAEEVHVLSSYDNGKDGEAPVTYVGFKAFYYNSKIKRMFFPESVIGLEGQAFSLMSNLEYLEMPGLVYTSTNPTYTFGDKSVTFVNARDNWTDTYNLTTIVVGEGFNNDCRSFFIHKWSPDDYQPILDIYVKGDYVESIFSGSTRLGMLSVFSGAKDGENYQLTGDIYYYDESGEKCGHYWHYENGYAVKNSKEHTIRENVCVDCGYIYNKDFHIKWREDTQAYEFMCVRMGNNDTVITVPESYNDGIHGEAVIKSIGPGAFYNMGNLKKVIIPECVERVESVAFGSCSQLEEVIMPGVKVIAGNNNFINCVKLSKIVINNEISICYQAFLVESTKYSTYVPLVDGYLISQDEGKFVFSSSNNNNMITGTLYFYNENPGTMHGLWWNYDANGDIKAYNNPHVYNESDVCTCGQINPHGLKYSYDASTDTYYVSGVDSRTTLTEFTVHANYADGVDGRTELKPVTRIGELAFSGNSKITKLTLPTSVTSIGQRAFMHCSSLETLVAPGVTTFEHSPAGASQTFQFAYCESLKTVILSGDITSLNERVFYNDMDLDKDGSIDHEKQTVVYLVGADNKITSIGPYNQLLSGDIYCYNETPGTLHGSWWSYDTDGAIVTINNPHVFNENNACECGYINPGNILYKYIGSSYTVMGLVDNTVENVEVLAQYNDGINGLKDVTTIGAYAFMNSKVVTVKLPETVTTIENRAFMWCYNLTTVIAPGVKEFNDPEQLQFVYCDSLVSVVLSAETVSIASRVFFNNTGLKEDGETYYGTNQADILLNGSTSKFETIGSDNQILTGDVYVYASNINTHGKVWTYDTNGNIVKANNPHNFNEDLECECGAMVAWENYGIKYEWNSATNSYIVRGLLDPTLTEIQILGEYNDGVNGKAEVTAIGASAFALGYPNYNTTVKKIVIHENVKVIQDRAFMWMMGVEVIDAKGVDTLEGTFQFAYCESLKTIVLSGNLTTLQHGTFYDDANSEPDLNRPYSKETVSVYLYGASNKITNVSSAPANDMLNKNAIYTYSETSAPNTWHYVDGVPTLWA